MRSTLFVATGLLALGACGGTTEVGGIGSGAADGGGTSSSSGGSSSSGSGSSSGGSSSSSGGGSAACPPTQPEALTPCSPLDAQCEYGDSPSPRCTALWTCTPTGWVFDDRASTCVTGTCPSTYGSVPKGQACAPDGLDCAYAEGQCDCSTLGGPAWAGGGAVWQCLSPGSCPEPRPRVGSACLQPNQQCDYGACSGGVALQCTNGYWQVATVPCPL